MFAFRTAALAFGLVSLLPMTQPSLGQAYPTGPITVVVAFAPGGVADSVARMVGQKLGERLGQNVVVENRGGAGGNNAARMVAGANPDGHMLLVTTTALAINETLYKNKGYATEDLRPVAIVATTPEALVVNPGHPAKDLRQLVDGAKTRPINFGTAGVGTGSYIAAEYFFKNVAKIDALHVPFQGGAPALNALLGGHIDVVATSLPPATGQIRQNLLRGLGVASATRASAVPDVPTFAEGGFPDFHAASWAGFFVHARTPGAVAAKLNAEIAEILKLPDIRQRLGAAGFDPLQQSEDEAARYFKSEVESWGRMVRATGASVE
jgi:tripartite-type tricarboxylate transporter receptor subunit TctC